MQTATSVQWNIAEREETDPWMLRRIREHIQRTHGEAFMLSDLWELPTVYSNLGTFVVGASLPEGFPIYDVVLQYGVSLYTMRQDKPLHELLVLDGFEIIIEYREAFLGVSIAPTLEQVQAFVVCFRSHLNEWIEYYKTLETPRCPLSMDNVDIFDDVFKRFSEEERDIHRRAERFVWDALDEDTRHSDPSFQKSVERIEKLTSATLERLEEWWKIHCADYSFPPSPTTEPITPLVLTTFFFEGKKQKQVTVIGQIVVVPAMYEFFSHTTPGFALVERTSARQIATWLPINPGGKEGACAFAHRVNALTNWQEFDTLSDRQITGLSIKVREMLCTTYDEYKAKLTPSSSSKESKPKGES